VMCERIAEAFFWVGKRGEASPTPDAGTGIPVPDRSESSRFVMNSAFWNEKDADTHTRINLIQILTLQVLNKLRNSKTYRS